MSHWGQGFQQDQVRVCHVCEYCGRGAGVSVSPDTRERDTEGVCVREIRLLMTLR